MSHIPLRMIVPLNSQRCTIRHALNIYLYLKQSLDMLDKRGSPNYKRIIAKIGTPSDKYQKEWKSRLRRKRFNFSPIFGPVLQRVVR